MTTSGQKARQYMARRVLGEALQAGCALWSADGMLYVSGNEAVLAQLKGSLQKYSAELRLLVEITTPLIVNISLN